MSEFLKKLFFILRNRVAFLVSICLTLVLSGTLISVFFASGITLENLAQTRYVQSRVSQILAENQISSQGPISVKLNDLRSAHIKIEKANLTRSGEVWRMTKF